MKIRLTGGLANTMFMYLFGRGLSLRKKEPVQYVWNRSTWDFALDKYNVELELVKPSGTEPIYDEGSFEYDAKVFEQPSNTYYRGYWQSPKYWQEFWPILRKELTLKEPVRPEVEQIAKRLVNDPASVFIHVRRGDYTNVGTAAFHGNLSMDYYEKAIAYVRQRINNPRFYVFSDDPSWCMQNFQFPVISTENFQQHEDLYLMSHAWHGIGANSTFSWFANWLGDYPNRVVVMPQRWFSNPEINTNDLIPQRWARL